MSKIVDFFNASRKGKKQLFETLLRPHIPLLYRKAVYWTKSSEDADDLLQDLLVKLATRVDDMREIDNLAPWLVQVLYRQFVDQYRAHVRNPVISESRLQSPTQDDSDTGLIDNAVDDTDDILGLESRTDLMQALNTLSGELRHVFILMEYKGYTVDEVAHLLKVRPGTVKSRNHRAKQKLKKVLKAGTVFPSPSC